MCGPPLARASDQPDPNSSCTLKNIHKSLCFNENIVLENRFPAEKATISSPAARACSVELRCLGGCNGVAQQNAMQQATNTIPTVFVIYQLIYFLKQISFRVWHTRVATLLDLPYEEKLLLI